MHYHFHSADGGRDLDALGIDLPDDAQARRQAVAYAGEVLRHDPDKLWDQGHWRVEVTNEDGRLLFTVITLAVDAPPP